MKILTFLTGKAGKLALSAAQAVGLSAAVGVAGVAAWQMLSGGGEVNPDTVFSSYNDEDVVYVAGGAGSVAGTGGYAGYGDGGEVQSGIRAKLSKDIELMQRDAARLQISDEPQVIKQEQQISAYQMDGKSDGLGMGKNAAKELGIGSDGDMSAFQAQLANLQAAATAKQKEAEQAALAAGGDVAKAAAALQAQGSGSGKWGMAGGMARAGGSNLNSSPLQAGGSGEGQTLAAGGRAAGRLPERLGAAERAAQFEGGRDSVIASARRSGGGNTLEGLRKQSADVASNKNRSANEATRGFMAAEKLSGGVQLRGGETMSGGGGSSADFNNEASTQMGAMSGKIDDLVSEAEEYEKARKKLRRHLGDFAGMAIAASCVSFFGYLILGRARKRMRRYIEEFKREWGEKAYEARYDKFQYWKKAKRMTDAIYWSMAGGPGAVLMTWGILSMAHWGTKRISDDDFAEYHEDIPTDPHGANSADDSLNAQ